MKLQLKYPVKPYVLNQPFGGCLANLCDVYHGLGLAGHNGEDLEASDGKIVRATHDGVVVFAGEDGSAGLGVVVRTNKKFEYGTGEAFFKSISWHLKAGSIKVKSGDYVKVGDAIALADNTGLSTGSHLHFGLKPVYQGENDWTWWNAEQNNGYKGAIDPAPYWTGEYAEPRYKFTTSMGFGSEGYEVKMLQSVLQGFNCFPSTQELTTFYGKVTEQAVKTYQHTRGIVTWGTPWTTGFGRFGPKTMAKINAEQGL